VKTSNAKSPGSTSRAPPFVGVLLCALWAGCASHSDTPPIPAPGSGIAEFRQITQLAHRSVANMVDSLQTVAREPTRADADFDRAFSDLELTSLKARSRAEALIARGQKYFDEWKEHLAATNQRSSQTDYDNLYNHFTRIRECAGGVREEFRPFMASLRKFRARLDQPSAARAGSSEDIDALTASGHRVLDNLESLSAALDAADAELRVQHALKR
jgi:hypothetical protein